MLETCTFFVIRPFGIIVDQPMNILILNRPSDREEECSRCDNVSRFKCPNDKGAKIIIMHDRHHGRNERRGFDLPMNIPIHIERFPLWSLRLGVGERLIGLWGA